MQYFVTYLFYLNDFKFVLKKVYYYVSKSFSFYPTHISNEDQYSLRNQSKIISYFSDAVTNNLTFSELWIFLAKMSPSYLGNLLHFFFFFLNFCFEYLNIFPKKKNKIKNKKSLFCFISYLSCHLPNFKYFSLLPLFLGENEQHSFAHDMNWKSFGLYGRDQPPSGAT